MTWDEGRSGENKAIKAEDDTGGDYKKKQFISIIYIIFTSQQHFFKTSKALKHWKQSTTPRYKTKMAQPTSTL